MCEDQRAWPTEPTDRGLGKVLDMAPGAQTNQDTATERLAREMTDAVIV